MNKSAALSRVTRCFADPRSNTEQRADGKRSAVRTHIEGVGIPARWDQAAQDGAIGCPNGYIKNSNRINTAECHVECGPVR